MPKIKCLTLFIASGFMLVSLSSCKVYYTTADIDSQLKASLEPMYANTQKFTAQLTDLHGQMAGLNCSDTQEPFKSAVILMNQVDALTDVLIQLEQKVNGEYVNFKQYTLGKTQITSGTEEWQQLKQTKKKSERSCRAN